MKNLTLAERERITDSMLKIQSVRHSLIQMNQDNIDSKEEIETCLETADESFRKALGYKPARNPASKRRVASRESASYPHSRKEEPRPGETGLMI